MPIAVLIREGESFMKDVFTYNADITKTAYLNWQTNRHDAIHNMITLAKGYMEASIVLADAILADNYDKKADKLIFPILRKRCRALSY